MVILDVSHATKEIHLRGNLMAPRRVKRAIRDVNINGVWFRSVDVHESHINSSTPRRILVFECGPNLFDLDIPIRQAIGSNTSILIAESDQGQLQPSSRSEFWISATSLSVYVRLTGLFDQPWLADTQECQVVVGGMPVGMASAYEPRTTGGPRSLYLEAGDVIEQAIASALLNGESCQIRVPKTRG